MSSGSNSDGIFFDIRIVSSILHLNIKVIIPSTSYSFLRFDYQIAEYSIYFPNFKHPIE